MEGSAQGSGKVFHKGPDAECSKLCSHVVSVTYSSLLFFFHNI